MSSLKVLTLNCEGHKHLEKIVPFLKEQRADVMCLQEVFKVDVPVFEKELGVKAYFSPNMTVNKENVYDIAPLGEVGIAILSALPVIKNENAYYVGNGFPLPEMVDGQPNSINRSVQWVTTEKDGESFTVANTHFTWAPNGETSDLQREQFKNLAKILDGVNGLTVLCGDFNAPRGSDIYTELSKKYTDNIPAEVTSTLDPELHRAGDRQLVVDGMFTTPGYLAKNVQVFTGVSDHRAVVGEIQK